MVAELAMCEVLQAWLVVLLAYYAKLDVGRWRQQNLHKLESAWDTPMVSG
jgi:hypothetical protein